MLSEEYWPATEGSRETYGKYTVILTSQTNSNDYIVRKMDIAESQSMAFTSSTGFSVTHIQYLKWTKDSVPTITSPVLEIANMVQNIQIGSGNKPIVVMCKYVKLVLILF